MRRCCSAKCAKWTTLSISLVCIVLGIVLGVFWGRLLETIVNKQLSVANNNTKGFKMWHETPIPMYLEFHMFNWTNPHLVEKYPDVKPSFEEMGPYIFYEHHLRENVTFNDNDTVTYLNKRTWRFEPEKSNGSLDDVITILNPIAVVVTNIIKDEHYLVKRAVNFFLEEKNETISLQKTIRELLFDGYNDSLIDIAQKLNLSGLVLPFKKFGWFVDRNGSATYDGVFNMYDGGKDISKLGVITKWNYQHESSYYPGQCAVVDGSSGELWYAPHHDEEVSIFASDLCSNVKLHRNGTETLYGVEGNRYVAQADIFDNGSYYPKSACFASGMPTGVRSVSSCKFGAPAYMSLPHFYLADPIYTREVDGLNPDPEKHSTQLSLEPNTGIPVRVHAAFQLNLLMRNMKGINMFSNVQTTLMPCFWFVQTAELTEDLSSLAKTIIVARSIGTNTGYGLLGLGLLLFIIFAVVTCRKGWKSKEEEALLKDESN